MIKLDMEDPGICDNCIFCRENPNTGASECILKPNHYEVDIHSKDENCPIIIVNEAEWKFTGSYNTCMQPNVKCSACSKHNSTHKTPFCPYCGAKMTNPDPFYSELGGSEL